jgi:hypothetical protein
MLHVGAPENDEPRIKLLLVGDERSHSPLHICKGSVQIAALSR